jgi:hypothetical protein
MRFGSKKVTDKNGIVWDSTTEYNYSLILDKLQEKGEIKNLERQVSYNLIPSFKDGQGNNIRKMDYVADFVYIDVATNNKVILDVKGSAFNIDPVFTNKWKLLKYNLKDEKDIQFKIMIKYKDVWYDLESKEDKKTYKTLHAEANKQKKAKKEAKEKVKSEKTVSKKVKKK